MATIKCGHKFISFATIFLILAKFKIATFCVDIKCVLVYLRFMDFFLQDNTYNLRWIIETILRLVKSYNNLIDLSKNGKIICGTILLGPYS